MASEEIDKVWNEWVGKLSQSYGKTVDLLEQQKTADAAQEIKAGMGATERKIYSETASAFPKRYEGKISDEAWADWSRQLYVKILKAEKTLSQGKADEARPLLPGLREQFYVLHARTGTRKANDFIFAFQQKAAGEKVEAAELARLKAELDQAPPSLKAKEKADDYAKAKAEWAAKVQPILADGKVEPDELPALRQATAAFYKAYGMAFE